VVDLDAALGSGDNRDVIGDIIDAAGRVPVQVGGGVRDDAVADSLLSAGAARVVVGTRAVEDREWLTALANRHPERIVVAADVRDGRIVTRGWRTESGLDGCGFVRSLDDLPLAAVLVTDVSREGRMEGVDIARFRALVESTRHPLLAAGGIGAEQDLRELAGCGAAGAVLGMSLYTGAVDGAAVAMEFQA
jgi:phosphoribosylformimino-5-aminoimidazole carboxamide ribotide isomerase